MKEYPHNVHCAGLAFRCAWLFKTRDGDAAAYVNSATRESFNAKWHGSDLEVFESSEEFMGQQVKILKSWE